MKIKLSTDILNSIDTQKYEEYIAPFYKPYFHLEAGKEHYRLLMYLASVYDGVKIADIGTNRGASALALASNPSNFIYSLDIVNVRESDLTLPNIFFKVGNFIYDNSIVDEICECPFIMLDIDHEYHNEIQIYHTLANRGWKGIIVCDDIHLNDPMKRFWDEVSHPKIDITKYGHGSGTGVIVMDNTEFELV